MRAYKSSLFVNMYFNSVFLLIFQLSKIQAVDEVCECGRLPAEEPKKSGGLKSKPNYGISFTFTWLHHFKQIVWSVAWKPHQASFHGRLQSSSRRNGPRNERPTAQRLSEIHVTSSVVCHFLNKSSIRRSASSSAAVQSSTRNGF